jgi:hypothetical protein
MSQPNLPQVENEISFFNPEINTNATNPDSTVSKNSTSKKKKQHDLYSWVELNRFSSAQSDAPAEKEKRKSFSKFEWQLYASPSLVFGKFYNTNASLQNENGLITTPSYGMEAGTAMQYPIARRLKIKAGLQFNYTSFYLNSPYDNLVPGLGTLNTNSNAPAKSGAPSFYNNSIPIMHNETYQFSVPVGVVFNLLKEGKLQWNTGVTIQPTYIAGGNEYAYSSANLNYVNLSSSLNKWNLNAGFETFITYKMHGVNWQLGPQIRYQFISTYSSNFTGMGERVAIYGIKFGISKALH